MSFPMLQDFLNFHMHFKRQIYDVTKSSVGHRFIQSARWTGGFYCVENRDERLVDMVSDCINLLLRNYHLSNFD